MTVEHTQSVANCETVEHTQSVANCTTVEHTQSVADCETVEHTQSVANRGEVDCEAVQISIRRHSVHNRCDNKPSRKPKKSRLQIVGYGYVPDTVQISEVMLPSAAMTNRPTDVTGLMVALEQGLERKYSLKPLA